MAAGAAANIYVLNMRPLSVVMHAAKISYIFEKMRMISPRHRHLIELKNCVRLLVHSSGI